MTIFFQMNTIRDIFKNILSPPMDVCIFSVFRMWVTIHNYYKPYNIFWTWTLCYEKDRFFYWIERLDCHRGGRYIENVKLLSHHAFRSGFVYIALSFYQRRHYFDFLLWLWKMSKTLREAGLGSDGETAYIKSNNVTDWTHSLLLNKIITLLIVFESVVFCLV